MTNWNEKLRNYKPEKQEFIESQIPQLSEFIGSLELNKKFKEIHDQIWGAGSVEPFQSIRDIPHSNISIFAIGYCLNYTFPWVYRQRSAGYDSFERTGNVIPDVYFEGPAVSRLEAGLNFIFNHKSNIDHDIKYELFVTDNKIIDPKQDPISELAYPPSLGWMRHDGISHQRVDIDAIDTDMQTKKEALEQMLLEALSNRSKLLPKNLELYSAQVLEMLRTDPGQLQ